MTIKLVLTMIIAVLVSANVSAQQLASPEAGSQSVVNGDRGRAFIIQGDTQSLSLMTSHGKALAAPEQYTIFLGGGWKAAALRARQPRLAALLANVSDPTQSEAMDQSGIKNFFGSTSSQETFTDVTGSGSLSDLEIESLLTTMLNEGSLGRPTPNTIYVVFLEPGLGSTLGNMIGGKHYLAYHNFFTALGARIHYVVVPFISDTQTAQQIALRAFLAAVANPTGAVQQPGGGGPRR